jgi:hypothetical protein
MSGMHEFTWLEVDAERRREVIAADMRAARAARAAVRSQVHANVPRLLVPLVAAVVALLGPRPA